MNYKPKVINTTDPFFNIFQKVIKETPYPEKTKKIKAKQHFKGRLIEKYFKFDFQWQDENICGVDVFEERIESKPKKMKRVLKDYRKNLRGSIEDKIPNNRYIKNVDCMYYFIHNIMRLLKGMV